MVNYREILRLKQLGYSQREIAASVHSSRSTISDVLSRTIQSNVEISEAEKMTNDELKTQLYPEKTKRSMRKMPDCAYMHKELAKPGVTLTLLWSEYCEQCVAEGEIPYQYTQFCDHYRNYARKTKATMRIKRKPGESLEVDWAGKTLTLYDEITGEANKAYLFVATLPCSLYSYAEAFDNMKTESWIEAHIKAYRFFGGSTRILVPDNLKTAVIKHGKYDVLLNRTYNEMAEHYRTAIIPARPAAPKDKPNAEGSVGTLSIWIIAALRNEKFFSLAEMNQAIKEKLTAFNQRPFQKKPGSRLSAFETEEKDYLTPLPASHYEMANWLKAKISYDYLITVDQNKYSVPYELIGQTVDIRYTGKTIEVFFNNHRIASHIRKKGYCDPQILPEHMPLKHRKYLKQDKETYLKWAKEIGEATLKVMQSFLEAVKTETHSYKSCGALMRLSDKYTVVRIEAACSRALAYSSSPSIRNIKTILKNGRDKIKTNKPLKKENPSGSYSFLRGASYYGDEKDA